MNADADEFDLIGHMKNAKAKLDEQVKNADESFIGKPQSQPREKEHQQSSQDSEELDLIGQLKKARGKASYC